jgi:hypothetical protein
VDIENCGYDYTGKTVYLTPRALNDGQKGLNPGHAHFNWTDQCDFNSITGSYFQNYFTVTNPSETPDGPDAGDSD